MSDIAQSDRATQVGTADETLLEQIREDYRYCLEYWREIFEDGDKNMEFVAGRPFTQAELDERAELGAPVVCPDEISQYTNQAVNNLRQNKRAVKVNPKGKGATDKDAEKRSAIIRGIEYQSNAQAAYTTGYEGAILRNIGAWRINLDYISEDGFEVQPRIKRIPNSRTVLFDPNAKEADRSDQKICFVVDVLRKTEFARRFPKAEKRSFSAEDIKIAPDWLKGENIVIAEYWRVETDTKRKIQVKSDDGAILDGEEYDKLDKDSRPEILNERKITQKSVVQYITNGVEILEKNEWIGNWIPIIGVFGKEIYTAQGGNSKLEIQSLVTLARDPQKMLAFIASQEAEEFGMAPRAPLVGAKGQFASDWDAWMNLNKVRRAFVQYDLVVDQANNSLPAPTRPAFEPHIDQYQLARESWRRAVQSSMGIMPLPTEAQRQNQKSGVALERIQTQQQVGSFHFTDNFDRALENTGRQLNELITKTMNSKRQVGVRNPDESHALMHVLTEEEFRQIADQLEASGDNDYLITDRGEFDVTISTGPSMQSEREEGSAFVDTLLSNLDGLPLPPEAKAALLAQAIKLKNLGPIGDEIAKILDPNGDGADIPPQVIAKMSQLQQQLSAVNEYAKKIEQDNEKLEMEKKAKVLDNQAKAKIAEEDRIAKIAIAEIQSKAQVAIERAKWEHEAWKITHQSAADAALQAGSQAHEADMSQMGHEQTLEQQEQAGAQQAALAQQQAEQKSAE